MKQTKKHVHRWQRFGPSERNMFPYVGCKCGAASWDEYDEQDIARILNKHERQKGKKK